MRLNLSREDAEELLPVLQSWGADDSARGHLAKAIEEAIKEADDPLHKRYREVANEQHGRDGELEFDDDAVVSIGEDPGAYVMAWRWVDESDAGVCPECGDFPGSDTYGTEGDGYDGLCPSCADKSEEDEDDVEA